MTEHRGGALRLYTFTPTPSEDQEQLASMFPVGSALRVYGDPVFYCLVCCSSRNPEHTEQICTECWEAYVQ